MGDQVETAENAKRPRDLLREALFRRGSQALRNATGIERDLYACPLCQRATGAAGLKAGLLTIEHVPPRSRGGRPLVLTCRDCNTTAGHTLDAAASQRLVTYRFVESLAMQRGVHEGLLKLHMGGQALNVETSIEGDTVKLKILSELNAPDAGHQLREALEQQVREGAWDGSTFKLSTIHGFHSQFSRLSDLRAAYLAAFAKLGYQYAFSKQLSPVREQLMKPNDAILPECFCIFLGWEAAEERDLRIVRDPFHLLFAQIDRYGMILPGLEPPEDPWTPFLERAKRQKLQRLTGSSIGWPVKAEMLLDFPSSAQ